MSESQNTKPWQVGWWSLALTTEQRADCLRRVDDGASPGPSYFILIILSTLIASYGLLANSTATVIGAMIVAPLMGPILGLAMGTARTDFRMFRRSLVAEVIGVILVIATGIMVAKLAGVGQIDFLGSEIAGRTRPTLYDLAIGFSAGLAGAYCLVHPGLQASIAGVAIAVALVPPLAVTGITCAGWLGGQLGFAPVFGSFMLFFANFLTIEFASMGLFYLTGFRPSREFRQAKEFQRSLALKLVLLLMTAVFLTNQLHRLVRERIGLTTSRTVLSTLLADIPGADLDDLKAELDRSKLTVHAVIGSRSQIDPPLVAQFEAALHRALRENLGEVGVKLIVRTVTSTYASSEGFLYEPRAQTITPDQQRQQGLDATLRRVLSNFPGVSLEDFRVLPEESQNEDEENSIYPVLLTLSSPYEFSPRRVRALEGRLSEELAKIEVFEGRTYRLRVRTVLVKTADNSEYLTLEAPQSRSDEGQSARQREELLLALLEKELDRELQVSVTGLHLSPVMAPGTPQPQPSPTPIPIPPESAPAGAATPTPTLAESSQPQAQIVATEETDRYLAKVELLSDHLVPAIQMQNVRTRVEMLYSSATDRNLSLHLDVITTLGSEVFIGPATSVEIGSSDESASTPELISEFERLIEATPNAELSSVPRLSKGAGEGNYVLHASVTTPSPLTNRAIIEWQERLLKDNKQVQSLELRITNLQGQSLRLVPSRRPTTVATPAAVP